MSSTATLYTILNAVYDSTNHALRMVLNYIHTHASDAQGGQLDWDSVWSDAVHSHASDAEGGTIDHGTALSGLTDDDHTQYQKESLLTTAGDMPYATAASTWARLGIGTALQVLRTNAGATAPEWAAGAQFVAATDRTANRALDGTVYQNTTGNLMLVAISYNSGGFNPSVPVTHYIGSANPPTTVVAQAGTVSIAVIYPCFVIYIVPSNWYYKSTGTGTTLLYWVEYS